MVDSGTVGDGVTNDNTLTLTGLAEANSTVKLYDGATLLGSSTVGADGSWSYTTVALADGSHNLTAAATDAAGNRGSTSDALHVTVDTAAPVAPTILSFSNDTGNPGDGLTNDNTLTLSGLAEADSTVKLYDGGTLLGSAKAGADGSWSYTTATLSDGGHNFTAVAVDEAGNVGVGSTALHVNLDTVAPSAPTIASFSNDSGVLGDGLTNDNTLTFTGLAEANSTVKLYDGATLLGTTKAGASGSWSYTTTALSDGNHNFTAAAVDAAGNASAASAALRVAIDTTVPTAPIIASFSTVPGIAGNGLANDNALTLTGTVEIGSSVKIYDGATLLGTATAIANGSWSFVTTTLSDGGHNLTAAATDVAGNTSAISAALHITIDTAPASAPVIAACVAGTSVSNGNAGANVLVLDGSASADSLVKVYDGATLLGSVTANSSGGWSFTTASLTAATHSFVATVANATNTSTASSAVMSIKIANTFDGSGAVASETITFSDNSREVFTFGIIGQKWTTTDTLYGSNGKALSQVWSNGATTVQTETWNADGTVNDIHYYGITGQAYTEYDVVYGSGISANKAVSASYSNGMASTWSYNSDGSLHELVTTGITGQKWTTTDTLYANGKALSQVWSNGGTTVQTETWNADGTIHDVHYYGITGQAYTDYDVVYGSGISANKAVSSIYSNGMASTWSYNSDGSLHEQVTTGITGQKWTTTDTLYANGKVLSQVWSNGTTTVQTESWKADGTVNDIHYYGITGQAYTEYVVVYGSGISANKAASASYSNGTASNWSYNSDGSLHELVTTGITGQKWTTTDTLYANGKALSQVWSNGATTVQTESWKADGTVNDIHYYGITGQAYTEYVVVYGSGISANKAVSASYSNGMASTWSYNSDGSLHELVTTGITGQKWTTTDTLYANGKALSQVWSNGATTVQTETWNADGTVNDIHYYGITGQAYTEYAVVYGSGISANKAASAIYSNGMSSSWTYNSDGSLHEQVTTGIAGQKYTTTDTLYGANGKALSQVWSNGGTTVQTESWKADGTVNDIHYYGITGQAYTEYVVVYGSGISWPTRRSQRRQLFQRHELRTGATTAIAGSLHELVTIGITDLKWTTTDTLYANGKALSQVWSNGSTTVQTESWKADGTVNDIHYYGVTGQAYTDYDVV